MAFYANSITYAGIPSEFFNLYLGGFNDSGDSSTATSSDIVPLTQKLFRRPVPIFWGSEQTPVLQFPMSLYSPEEITAPNFSKISQWLFGQMNCQELRICQPDMMETFFRCFLTAPQIVRTGNIITGTTFTVTCDSPWGYLQPVTLEYDYSANDGYIISDDIVLFNNTANNFYTYPTELIITANIFGGNISIINSSDNDREFSMSLSANEIVTINCDTQVITSDVTTYPIANLTNKKFLRLLPGYNYLTLLGNISNLSITFPIATKIGG
jgi:hypothetical protein